MLKHIGKHGDRKVAVVFREIPGDDHMCLVVYPETLPSTFEDAIMKVIESPAGQQENTLANALHRNLLPDGRIILEALHREGMLKKIATDNVVVTPTPTSSLKLSELNRLVREMESGDEARKRMAELDSQRGMVPPDVKRKAEAEFKSKQASVANSRFQAPENSALDDRTLAANMLAQAKRMEAEAKGMINEAARMKKEAQALNPSVRVEDAVPQAETAPKKRGRPRKEAADAVQS
jgi:hypothetical protein|nr:hypothetical protein [Oxalobacteraceae bacterium]